MTKEICYWSVGDGKYAYLLQALVHSFHEVGMTDDFFAISDRQIQGAYTYIIPQYKKDYYLFKLSFLRDIIGKLDYKYFVFLDADCYFVRKLTNVLDLLHGDHMHVFLESDCASSLADFQKGHWKHYPLDKYVQLMRDLGVKSPKVYNVNAGFILVDRDHILQLLYYTFEFWDYARKNGGWTTTEEPPLAYAMHKMTKDADKHTLRANPNIWASDWTNHFKGVLPYDKPWIFTDFLTKEPYTVQPAIVHALVDKEPLIRLGQKIIAN